MMDNTGISNPAWISPYSLKINILQNANVIEPLQNYYYYDYNESKTLINSYVNKIPQAETLVQLHYTHLLPFITRANDIFIRSMLKPASEQPDFTDKNVIAVCIVKDSQNIVFALDTDYPLPADSELAGYMWTEVIATLPVINNDPLTLNPAILSTITESNKKSKTQATAQLQLLDTMDSGLCDKYARATEAYNICRIEFDKLVMQKVKSMNIKPAISHVNSLVTPENAVNIQWSLVGEDAEYRAKLARLTALKYDYEQIRDRFMSDYEKRNNLYMFNNGEMQAIICKKWAETQQPVLCFIGKYIPEYSVNDTHKCGEYSKFITGMLEAGYSVLPINMEVTYTKNLVRIPDKQQSYVVDRHEYSYRSRLARVVTIINEESILYGCPNVENNYEELKLTLANDNYNDILITDRYMATGLLIWKASVSVIKN